MYVTRTAHGEELTRRTASWLEDWGRLSRQVFLLADGSRQIEYIAKLVHKPSAVIDDIAHQLAVNGYVRLHDARKVLAMDVVLLRESFSLIPDKNKFAESFYIVLFTTFPDAKKLFKNTDFKKQYVSLMSTIQVVLEGIEKGDNLIPTLHRLGARHKGYGAMPEHYHVVGTCLLTAFKLTLEKEFTPAMAESWEQAYELIATEMIKGANYPGPLEGVASQQTG